MNNADYLKELSKCVRCGTCKTLCPTYLTTLNETMGARGRVAMLGELGMKRLAPSQGLAEKIFSCMLCSACKGTCPVGINITEMIYKGRSLLRKSFKRGRLPRTVMKLSMSRLDTFFSVLRGCRKVFYGPLYKAGLSGYLPEITARPFRKSAQVYKNMKKTGRVAIFAGCSVNYIYPDLGHALSDILLSKGYEVVVFKGELCCGAPLRSMGLEQEAKTLAEKNLAHFNKVHAEAIISMCPTCTMVMRQEYPFLAGDHIINIMDLNEFLIKHDIMADLEIEINPGVITYHDPCHLNFGLGIREEPRHILENIKGIKLVEMKHADECCGFAGLFSLHFKGISGEIGRKKINNILQTGAETVVTSCPGCMMQLEALKRETGSGFGIRHIVEVIDEAMHG